MPLPRALAALVQPIARRAVGSKRAGIGALLVEWEAIAGARWALQAWPQSLRFPAGRRDGGTLLLRVEPVDALELQHDSPMLLARINGHFGYRAVERLQILQAPVNRPRRGAPPPTPLPAAEQAAIDRHLATIADEGLRRRLEALGQAIWRRNGAG